MAKQSYERDREDTSTVLMAITSSTGTWLSGCLQPQRYYVTLHVKDKEGKIVADVALSFEQAARMLLSNGNVPCTLTRYRGADGKLKVEEVAIPETVHKRMVRRLGTVQEELKDRIADVEQDLYDILNGNKPGGKKAITELLHNIRVLKDHFASNQTYMVSRAEEEMQEIQENAAGQLGVYLQTQFGLSAEKPDLKQILGVDPDQQLLTDGTVPEPVTTGFKKKPKVKKKVDDMTAMEVADVMNRQLNRLEREENTLHKNDKEGQYKENRRHLFSAMAVHAGGKVFVSYISYQGTHTLKLEEAREYLKFLLALKSVKGFKTHVWYNRKDK